MINPLHIPLHLKTITLPRHRDARGSLTYVQGCDHIPFNIKRVYYLYDVPTGEGRGGHAHRELQQLIVPLSGCFDIILDNGWESKRVTLDKPYEGLLINSLIWRELDSFSSGASCLVLASLPYDESDYIRDYSHFLSIATRRD
jgi:hypothetical protein